MFDAFKPFTQYITYLAEGKLDGYFNPIQPEEWVTDLGVRLPTQPMLLLHGLGEDTDMEEIKNLFVSDTVFVVFLASFSWRVTNPGAAIYLLSLVQEKLAAHSSGSATTGDFIFHADHGRTCHRNTEMVTVTLNR